MSQDARGVLGLEITTVVIRILRVGIPGLRPLLQSRPLLQLHIRPTTRDPSSLVLVRQITGVHVAPGSVSKIQIVRVLSTVTLGPCLS